MVTAGKTELSGVLLFVEPPGNIDVCATRAVLIVHRQIFQRRDLPAQPRTDGIHNIFADEPARIRETIRETR